MKSARIFALTLAVSMVGMAVLADSASAQGRGRGGMGDFMRSPLMLLQIEQVQDDLELVDEQMEELNAIRDDMRSNMRETFRNFREMNEDERRDKMKEVMDDLNSQVNEILLPIQQKRLKQLSYQTQANGRGGVASALEGGLGDELNITEDQKEKMKEVAEKAQEELEEETKKLRAKAQDKVLGVLTSDQRKKFEELMGDRMDIDMGQAFRNMGRNRGGNRGGRNDF